MDEQCVLRRREAATRYGATPTAGNNDTPPSFGMLRFVVWPVQVPSGFMRALLATNDYPPKPGGIQQYLSNLVGHSSGSFRVLGPGHPGAPPDPDIVRGHASYMLPTAKTYRWLADHIADFEPDVVVFGAPHPLAQLGPRLSKAFGIPYVVIAHGAEVTVPGVAPVLRQVLGWTFRQASLVLTVSSFTARKVAAMGAADTSVLGAGVDLTAFRPAEHRADREEDGRLVLGCISRFVPRKGHLRVVAAAERLREDGLTVEVLLAGKGRLEARIRRRAARATVPVRVESDVPWEELPGLYRSCDVFVMPVRSRWLGLEAEGLGIVYLEASATGIPVVAGTSGGAPETVVPGVTGYVAASVGDIVEAVNLIFDQRYEMGAAARARAVDHYSWNAVARRFDAALKRAVEGVRSPS